MTDDYGDERMLCIRRQDSEEVVFADRDGSERLRMTVRIHGKTVKLYFDGDPDMKVYRKEIAGKFIPIDRDERNEKDD